MVAVLQKTANLPIFKNALIELQKIKSDSKPPDLTDVLDRKDKGTAQHQKQYAPEINPDGPLDKLFTWLSNLIKKLAFKEPVCFIIKTSDYNVGIEFGRILCLALKEELNCDSCIYTDNNNIELVVESNQLNNQILKISSDIIDVFKKNTKQLNYNLQYSIELKNSILPEITFNKAASEYRQFQLKIHGIK